MSSPPSPKEMEDRETGSDLRNHTVRLLWGQAGESVVRWQEASVRGWRESGHSAGSRRMGRGEAASSRGTTKDKGGARGEGGLKTQGRLGWAEALEEWAQSGSLRGSWGKDRSWESLLLDGLKLALQGLTMMGSRSFSCVYLYVRVHACIHEHVDRTHGQAWCYKDSERNSPQGYV